MTVWNHIQHFGSRGIGFLGEIDVFKLQYWGFFIWSGAAQPLDGGERFRPQGSSHEVYKTWKPLYPSSYLRRQRMCQVLRANPVLRSSLIRRQEVAVVSTTLSAVSGSVLKPFLPKSQAHWSRPIDCCTPCCLISCALWIPSFCFVPLVPVVWQPGIATMSGTWDNRSMQRPIIGTLLCGMFSASLVRFC